MMNGLAVIVVSIPRYLMIGGLTILALAFFSPQLKAMGADLDFELILPFAVGNFIPVGLMGIILAGLLSAYMSTASSFLNLAPAYVVNDIYKKYFRPDESNRTYIKMSYIVSIIVTIASILFGMVIESVDAATQWIVSALWGGSAAANVLKWYWWRFNSYGYFWGMLAGLIVALVMPVAFPGTNPLFVYPYILIFSAAGSLAGALLTKPEKEELLMKFYSTVRPWGFWKPIKNKVIKLNPAFRENEDFGRDMFNIFTGIIWQISLMAAPLALVIKNWELFIVMTLIALSTSYLLKKFWFEKLEKDEPERSISKTGYEEAPSE
jgi:Na+/proline symporter